MYLESWIHHIVKNLFGKNQEHRVDRADIRAYHDFKLRETLQYCAEKSAFYRNSFTAASLSPADIRGTADLHRLPFTEPHQISETPYRFLCTSQAQVARPYTFITSGTTGPQKKVFWSLNDLERITDFMAAGIGTVAKPGDRVLILLPDGRAYSQADLLFKGTKKFGAKPLVASFDIPAPELLRIIEETECDVIFAYTRRLFRLTRELQTRTDLSNRVGVLFLAAEYLPDPMRQDLQKIWGCRIHTHYGLTEMGLGVAVECAAGDGYHFNEADLILEVVDPLTGELVEDGVEGELVFTTLNRQAMPLIRYRTHDLSRVIPDPCACGASSLLKFGAVKKRLENIVNIGDRDELYPSLFDNVLFEFPGILDYQVTIKKDGGLDRLDFRIEMLPGEAPIPEICQKLLASPIISKNISSGRMSPPSVEAAVPGFGLSIGREKKMILDCR